MIMGRRDGRLVSNLDPMHVIMPLIYPGRCDNEAYISERLDLTRINEYLEKKNSEAEADEEGRVFNYTLFHLIVAAILKTIMLRPKLNYFIANKRLYERNEITGAFIVKKAFSDSGAEALAILKAEAADNIDSIYGKIKRQVYSCRSDALDGYSAAMDIVCRLPFFLVRFVAWVCRKLDVRGKVPQAIISSDPYYASVVFSNLGSIRLRSGYHHLTNWGTNSLFCIVGEKKWRPFF